MVLSKLPLAKEESSGDQLRSTYFKHGQIDPKLIKIIENYMHSNKELEACLNKKKWFTQFQGKKKPALKLIGRKCF